MFPIAWLVLLQIFGQVTALTDLLNRNTDRSFKSYSVCGRAVHKSELLENDGGRRGFKIYGGRAVMEEGTYPWAAKIRSGKFICSGVLISESFVLTAAHCVIRKVGKGETNMTKDNRKPVEDITVHLGSNDPTKIKEFSVVAYSLFNDGKWINNDIALLMVDRSLKDKMAESNMTRIQSICIPSQPPTSHQLMAIGWGHTNRDENHLAEELREAILDKVDCNFKRESFIKIAQTHFCVSAQDRSVCKGDSGGATMALSDGVWYLVGLTSFRTDDQCARNHHTWQTDVYKYNTWIVKSMKELKQAAKPRRMKLQQNMHPKPVIMMSDSHRGRHPNYLSLWHRLLGL